MVRNLKRGGMPRGMGKQVGEYIIDLDLTTYLNYVANKTPLKTSPAFDALGVADGEASGENDEFGDVNNKPANFTTILSPCRPRYGLGSRMDGHLSCSRPV